MKWKDIDDGRGVTGEAVEEEADGGVVGGSVDVEVAEERRIGLSEGEGGEVECCGCG